MSDESIRAFHAEALALFARKGWEANIHDLCTRMVVVDTFVSLTGSTEVARRDRIYGGERVREHGDDDSDETRRTGSSDPSTTRSASGSGSR